MYIREHYALCILAYSMFVNLMIAEEDVGHLQSARELAQTECDLWRMRALLSVHEADLDSAHRHLLQALAIAYKLGADSDSEQEEPGDPLESEDTQAIVAKLTSGTTHGFCTTLQNISYAEFA